MSRHRPASTDHPGPTSPASWTPPSPTPGELAGQVRDVLADLPRFLTSPLLRRRHRTWGASPAEVAAPMPGDDLLPHASYRATRAITIAATPEEVWPWLVQVGCGRGGWYADDLLDNYARPSARRIVPELQDIRVGQWLPIVRKPTERRVFVVEDFTEPSSLLWRSPSRTWAWRLVRVPEGRTRVVSRMRTDYDWSRPWTPVTVLLMELADHPMMRRMLLGIRDRAEAEHRRRTPVT